jgi:hypothetical protein
MLLGICGTPVIKLSMMGKSSEKLDGHNVLEIQQARFKYR